jgi:hypothetical protein
VFGSPRKWLIVATLASCAALAGPIAAAQASNAGIVSTFRAANPHLNADEAAVKSAVKAYKRDRRAGRVIRALRHEVRDIRALNRSLKHQRASTRKGRRGKAQLTRGLTLIGNAYAALANDIQKARAGHPVPAATINATVASDRKGRAKLLAGLRLLGVRVIA